MPQRLQRLSQSIIITALLYLITGMNHSEAVPSSTDATIPMLSLAELLPAPEPVAEVTSFH